MTFATALAKIPALDFIDTHVYPTDANAIANAGATAQIAHQAGKQAVMDEAWLYKGTGATPGGAGGSANLQAHQLSSFSLFAPLDHSMATQASAQITQQYNAIVSPTLAAGTISDRSHLPTTDRGLTAESEDGTSTRRVSGAHLMCCACRSSRTSCSETRT